MAQGRISHGHVEALTQIASPADVDLTVDPAVDFPNVDRDIALAARARQDELIAAAESMPVDTYRRFLRRWADRVGGGAERNLRRRSRRRVTTFEADDGMRGLRAILPPEQFALFENELRRLAEARWRAEHPDADGISAKDLSCPQRNADALVDMARRSHQLGDNRGEPLGSHIDVMVLIDAETLESGPREHSRCELDDTTPISPTAARRLLCDATILTALRDRTGFKLDLGYSQRCATAKIRKGSSRATARAPLRAVTARTGCARSTTSSPGPKAGAPTSTISHSLAPSTTTSITPTNAANRPRTDHPTDHPTDRRRALGTRTVTDHLSRTHDAFDRLRTWRSSPVGSPNIRAMSPETAHLAGLSADEVAQRVADGRVNDVPDAPVRTLGEITRANVFTPVNAILLTLLVLILVADAPGDALFVGVVVSNSIIGIIQELRARRELRRLAVLSEPRARVRRDGEVVEIDVGGVVADDLLELASGDQVVVDGEVLAGIGLEVDESLLTGESDAVAKLTGERVMSGSFVAAGSGVYRAEGIGAASYAAALSEEARRFALVDSELRRGVNQILRVLVWLIPPASALLLWRLLGAEDRWQEALRGTVGAAVAMVPDGLVLLTSLAFVAGVVALARRQVLAKELGAVELLARIDTLCLDKTGTITTGEISFESVQPMGGWDGAAATDALGAMAAADPSPNATTAALASACPAPAGWQVVHVAPFSSARKWASAEFAEQGLFYIGAPDMLLAPGDGEARDCVEGWAKAGRRVLLLSRAVAGAAGDDGFASERHAVAVVVLGDTIRHDAPEILAYFCEQGVDLKVISGDNAATVSAVAQRAGVPGAESYVDARDLPTETADLGAAMERNAVFGRVTPQQKRAMVGALQASGRTVAMTGDGVNDVLALKDADMGIAMGSGSSASRAVAELVLLDDSFATLPRVVDEGRKVINNVERISNLFIAKAAYALLITAAIGIMGVSFPFLPRHLTLIGTFSIGVPGIFLALAPSTELVRPGFLRRVLRFSVPAGAVAAACTMVVYEVARRASDTSLIEARTVATMTLLGLGLVILVVTSRPLRPWKIALAAAMGLLYVVVMAAGGLRDYFELDLPPGWLWGPVCAAVAVGGVVIALLPRFVPGLRTAGGRSGSKDAGSGATPSATGNTT